MKANRIFGIMLGATLSLVGFAEVKADQPKKAFSKNIDEADLQPTKKTPCVYPKRYESWFVTVPHTARWLIPQVAKDRGWVVVKDINTSGGEEKASHLPFCTFTSARYPSTPLFNEPSSGKYFIYDFVKKVEVLAWSQIAQTDDDGEIWVDHVNQIVWGPAINETIASNGQISISIKKLMTIDQALAAKDTFESRDFPEGSWKLPNYGDYRKSQSVGLNLVLPGLTNNDFKVRSNSSKGYGNPYWLFTGDANDEIQEDLTSLLTFSGKYGNLSNRGDGVLADLLDSMNRKKNYFRGFDKFV